MDIVERLNWLCTDWDKSQMVDGEPPLDDVRVGDLRKAAAEITRLRARLEEAEAAKADVWDEAMKAAENRLMERTVENIFQRDAEGPDSEDWDALDRGVFVLDNALNAIRALVNPYRSKTDEPQ